MDSETMIPTDKEVSKWYDENIDKDCSASSAIYKFRQWLEEYKLLNNKPTDEEYEDKILGEMLELAKNIPLHAKLRIAFTMDDYGNWDNGEYKGDKKLIEKYVNSAIRIFEEQLLNNNSDAVDFCEWASLVYYEGIGEQKGFWFDDRGECVATSTSELYKIFKSLPSPPIQQPKI